MHIIISGNVVDGLNHWGPFESGEAAHLWADDYLRGENSIDVDLESPAKGLVAEKAAEETRLKANDAIACIARYVQCDNASSDALDVLVQALADARAGVAQ